MTHPSGEAPADASYRILRCGGQIGSRGASAPDPATYLAGNASMALIDKLLNRTLAPAQPGDPHIVRVFARVLLDKAGRVQDVKLSRGCGDAALDQQALEELRQGRHPVTRVGATIACRWHEVVWSIPVQSGNGEGVPDHAE